ncbi:MAG: peptidylprolyl isomerase [Candidatus Cloacimonetes bacterium]|nr:peptidylprolyl isomerase [Candidatus Cloacimonadota bacterium]
MENKVLATVMGIPISQADVNTFISRLGQQYAAQYSSEEGQKQILEELINQQLFYIDAADNKLDETDEFKAEMEKMKAMVLTQINVTNLMNSINATDSEVEKYFEDYKVNFNTPESANTSHILVDTEELGNEIRAKIINKEISFEEAAKEYSSCPSGQNGGNLGSYPRGQMVPEYDNASFSMKEGEISNPVQTQFGFHIIKLNSKTEAGSAKFEDVKDKVKAELINDRQRAAYMDKVYDMRAKYKVEVL